MNAIAPISESSELVSAIERARSALDAGDVQAALMLSSGAYEQAKAAGAYAEKVKASRELIDKARRMQADALKIENLCYVAMADAVDEAQAKGRVARPGRKSNISDGNIFTLAEVGLNAQSVHYARKLRDAERAEPGFIERVVEARLDEGLEPSRASVKQAAGHAIGTKSRTKDERGNNAYFTPAEAIQTVLVLESFTSRVKEPACGRGNISKPMEMAGYDVLISDLVDYGTATRHGELQQIGDFLLSSPGSDDDGVDIVTNPPYGRGVLNPFIAHALRVHRPRKMALLLNINVMCGCEDADRNFFMEQNPPTRVYVFTRRLPMMHQDGWEGAESTSQMNTAWFIWERNEDGSYGSGDGSWRTIRVDWERYQSRPALPPGLGGNASPLVFHDDDEDEPEENLSRQTPRRTLDERVAEHIGEAVAYATGRDWISPGDLRRFLGVRPIVGDALVSVLVERGMFVAEPDENGCHWVAGMAAAS